MKQHNTMLTCLSKQCVFTSKEQKHACQGLSPNAPNYTQKGYYKMKTIIISILSFLFGGFAGITTMCLVQINRTNGNERFEKEDSSDEQDN